VVNYNAKHEGSYQDFRDQPDCPNYRATLARHARQLTDAGVDHVVCLCSRKQGYLNHSKISNYPYSKLTAMWAASSWPQAGWVPAMAAAGWALSQQPANTRAHPNVPCADCGRHQHGVPDAHLRCDPAAAAGGAGGGVGAAARPGAPNFEYSSAAAAVVRSQPRPVPADAVALPKAGCSAERCCAAGWVAFRETRLRVPGMVHQLRAASLQDIKTPDIAAWQRLPDAGVPLRQAEESNVMWKVRDLPAN
jgi:hypothetical protein